MKFVSNIKKFITKATISVICKNTQKRENLNAVYQQVTWQFDKTIYNACRVIFTDISIRK